MANVYIKPQYFGTQTEPFVVYFSWTERLPDTSVFTASNISATNATISDFRLIFRNNDLTTYQATITPPTTGSGNITITVAANVYDNNEAATRTLAYNTTSTNTLKMFTAPGGSQHGPFWVFIHVFIPPGTLRPLLSRSTRALGLYLRTDPVTPDEVTVTNGTLSMWTGVIVPEGSAFGDATYKALITPNDGVTNVMITVAANSIGDNPETTLNVPITAFPVNVSISDADIPNTTDFEVDFDLTKQRHSTIIGDYLFVAGLFQPENGTNVIQRLDLRTGQSTFYNIGPVYRTNDPILGLTNVGNTLYVLRRDSSPGRQIRIRLDRLSLSGNTYNGITIWQSTISSESSGYSDLTSDGSNIIALWEDTSTSPRSTKLIRWTTSGGRTVPANSEAFQRGIFPNLDVLTYSNGQTYFISFPISDITDTGSGLGLYRITGSSKSTITRIADLPSANQPRSLVTSGNTTYSLTSSNQIFNFNLANASSTRYRSPASDFLSTSDQVIATSFTQRKRYFVINKTVNTTYIAQLWRYNSDFDYEAVKTAYNTTIYDVCAFNDEPYIIYRIGAADQPVYLGKWEDDDITITQITTINTTDRFLICYNNQLFITDQNATTFRCYNLTGGRLAQNDFSLIHREPRGTIKSLSSSDEGVNITHRTGNRTLIYRYDTRGTYRDSISVSTDPSDLLLKATDFHNGFFFVINENLVLDSGAFKIVPNQVTLGGPTGIQYLGPTKITIRNFEPIDLKPLFSGETIIHEGIGALLNIDHEFIDGVLRLQFIQGRDPFFGADEIFFPLVPLNNSSFLEQEIYFSFQENIQLPTPNGATTIVLEQPDSTDMHNFIENADTIRWQSGFTPLTGVSLDSEGRLSTAVNTVTRDTETEIKIEAENPLATIQKNYRLIILNTHTNLKNASFWREDIVLRVYIDDHDVTDYLEDVSEIDKSLDSQFLNVQKVGDATIILNDPDGYFSAASYDNFFVENGLNRLGYNVPIKIEYGYKVGDTESTRVLFFGYILRIKQKTVEGQAEIVAIDYNEQILRSELHNIGVSKKIIYSAGGTLGKFHGEYPIPEIFRPLANQSLVGRARNFAILRSQNQDSLATEGVFNWSNIKVDNDKFQSEGDLIPYPPIFSFKSPYKHFLVSDILRELLISQNIFNYKFNTSILPGTSPAHFQNIGSAVYQNEEQQNYTTRDWFAITDSEGAVEFYYLLGAPGISNADKFIKKQKNNIITNLFIANPNTSLWKVDFEEDRNILWIWTSEKYIEENNIPLGTFDSSESNNKTSLLKYNITTNTSTTAIASDHGNPPQLAQRYLLGLRGETLNLHEYALPNNRGYAVKWDDQTLGKRLYYKFASSTHFGIANFDRTNETITQTIAQPNDTYGNASCFDIAIEGDNLFFGYTVGTATSSTLYIKQYNVRTSTETTLYQATTDYTSTDFFEEVEERTGAIYNGVFEIFANATHVYANVQLQKEHQTTANTRSVNRNAGAIFYKIPRTGVTNPIANDGEQYKLKVYEWCQLSPHSFVIYNNNVHFFEGSPHLYKYKPMKADNEEADWKKDAGYIRYDNNGQITSLGIAWQDLSDQNAGRYDTAYGAIDGPMKIVNEALHVFIGGQDAGIPDANNIVGDFFEIVYSNQINQVVPVLNTNDRTVYQILNDLNQLTYTFTTFENRKLVIESKLPKTAEFVSISGTTLTLKNPVGDVPLLGFIKVEQEYIAYEGITNITQADGTPAVNLLNIQRSQAGSVARFYPEGEQILFFDHIIDASDVDSPVLGLSMHNDYNFLANVVNVQYGNRRTNFIQDSGSIAINERKEATIPTPLDDHQKIWAQRLNRLYLSQSKDLQQQVILEMTPSYYLQLGEVVVLQYPNRAKLDVPARITRLQFSKTRTLVTLKTLLEEIITKIATPNRFTPQNGLCFDPIRIRIYYYTRWQNGNFYMDTAPTGEVVGAPIRYNFTDANGVDIRPDWAGNQIIVNDKTIC